MVKELGDGRYLFKNGAIATKKPNGQYQIVDFDKKVSEEFRATKKKQKGGKTKKGSGREKNKQKGGSKKKPKKNCNNQTGGGKNKNDEKLKLTVRMLREFYSKI